MEEKLPLILKIFEAKLEEVQPIVSNLSIIGLKYRSHSIYNGKMREAHSLLNADIKHSWSYRSLALAYSKKKHKINTKAGLTPQEKIALRGGLYRQRLEIWEILSDKDRAEDFIKIDCNHLYLNQLKKPLPIKKKTIGSRVEGWDLGFYYVKFYTKKTLEPILPV